MRHSLVPLVLSLTALPVIAQTQAGAPTAPLPAAEALPGARVRLVAPGTVAGRWVGTVLSRTADTLIVSATPGTSHRIAVSALAALEVSRGKSHALGAGRGALWGAGISGGLGALVALSAASDSSVRSSEVAAFVGSMAVGGAIWGVAIGAIIGAERWERFDTSAWRVGIAPRRDGMRVAVQMRR